MKETKIYLQYPWKFPDSPYYKYLINSPPGGIVFQNTRAKKGVITSKNFFWFSNFLKKQVRYWSNKLNLEIPNAHLSPKGDYDLIHCAHCLSKNKDKPWVADIESWWSMFLSGYNSKKSMKKVENILRSKNCKKILPWTEATKRDILEKFPAIKDKVELLYPAVPKINNIKKHENKKLKVIFVSRYFHLKGGLIALEVLEKLRKTHGIEGIVVSSVPERLKQKYPALKIYNLLPQQELFKLMMSSDIFLYPCFSDTFGFSLLEAMSFGSPIVALNTPWTPSMKEIVHEGVHGFLENVNFIPSQKKIGKQEREIIKALTYKTEKLILNKNLRTKMSRNCLNEIGSGKFSIEKRNKKLKKIYREALRV